MMLKKKFRRRIVLLLLFVSIAYLVFGMVPLFQGKDVHVDAPRTYTHSNKNGYYRLNVEAGEYYTFTFNYHIADEINPQIRLFSHSFKTVGIQKDPGQGTYVSIGFYAEHGGYYYITVVNVKNAFANVHMEKFYDHVDNLFPTTYVSAVRLLHIIIIAILFTTGVILSIVRYSQAKKKEAREWEINNTRICPTCGVKYMKVIKYCTACGYTFEKPEEYKNY
ncbi:MAG: hypothetical protein ACTSRE_14930 [Promethearchaeota archaeon]